MKNLFFINQTHSTNSLLWEMLREKQLPEGFVMQTDFQTVGKGQIGNAWESEAKKNLLFSIALYPHQIPVDEQFLISQIASLAIKKTLDELTDDITIKWPNDIYWKNKKLAGILIENSLQGRKIKSVVIGIGLNINQKKFTSKAPNPVSLMQIIGKRQNRKKILSSICTNLMELYRNLDITKIRTEYADSLYYKSGFHSFQTESEQFQAEIIAIHPDGQLELATKNGERKGFYFKEVQFL
ncbi:MAG: biotin--[acetyl-CoA-carboxylase] ligase [Paludibacter sp.]|nr:biotin--[acetyl-CoA-carboxylase] ligase [Paludibacter sp.]